jgi:nicotinic acid phosphoribosyltransferase
MPLLKDYLINRRASVFGVERNLIKMKNRPTVKMLVDAVSDRLSNELVCARIWS